MTDAREVLTRTIDNILDKTSTVARISEETLGTKKLLEELRHCDARTVQVDGQRYTFVSLESVIGAIEGAQIIGSDQND